MIVHVHGIVQFITYIKIMAPVPLDGATQRNETEVLSARLLCVIVPCRAY